MKKIAVLGAGSWGTALAIALSNAGNEVLLWSRQKELADTINKKHENLKYLPDIILSKKIQGTSELSEAILCDALFLVVPAQTLRQNCENLKIAGLASDTPLVICCKGIEEGTKKLMSEVVADILPKNPVAILSGPNFAREVAKGLPAAATLACADEKLGMELVGIIGNHLFRTYYSSDVIGAQIGGAVKNVLAIACGIAIGKGLGENARASLVTRGIVEITRLCIAKGGRSETLIGLSGIGDIMLTCGSRTSRNMSFGHDIGQGLGMVSGGKVTEGVATAHSVMQLADSLGVDMPISRAVNAIIHEGANVERVVDELLQRPLGVEI